MSNIIEEFYYGNIEPQEVNSELTPKLKKKLSNLAEKEEQLTARLNGDSLSCFLNDCENLNPSPLNCVAYSSRLCY